MPITIFEDENSEGNIVEAGGKSHDEDPQTDGDDDGDSGSCSDDDGLSEDRNATGSESSHDEGDEYEANLENSNLSPTLHNVPDPFSNSQVLSRPPHLRPEDEPIKSIETAHAPHSSDGSFSTTSRVHIDNQIDPLLDYVEPMHTPTDDENYPNPLANGMVVKHASYPHGDNRKVSEGLSTLPDELDYYKSPLPGRSPLVAYNVTPSRQMAYGPHHSRSNSAARHDSRPLFRSPSSVRAMQMSSPPPFANSPLSPKQQKRASPRHIRQSNSPFVSHSRDGTPTRRIRHQSKSQDSPARKPPKETQEFPLVLLHCTLHLIANPAAFPTEALEAAEASDRVKRNCALLHQKMDSTVLERGVLVQHPGDDYELLQDRILESLELKRPQIGACGHSRNAPGVTDGEADDKAEGEEVKARCADCCGHVDHNLLSQLEQQERRRWDIKVYAANGLMRAGAWSAAWREMEKVDVEVGVWLGSEDAGLGGRLEEWARTKEREEEQAAIAHAEEEARRSSEDLSRPIDAVLRETSTFQMPERTQEEQRSRASTAAVERPSTAISESSRHRMPFEGAHVETQEEPPSFSQDNPHTSRAPSPTKSSSTTIPTNAPLPLTTLLLNYATHLFSANQTVLLPILVLALGLYVARSGVLTSKSVGEAVMTHVHPTTTTVTESAAQVVRTMTETSVVSVTASPTAAAALECECDFEGMLEAKGLVALERGELERLRGLERVKTVEEEMKEGSGEEEGVNEAGKEAQDVDDGVEEGSEDSGDAVVESLED